MPDGSRIFSRITVKSEQMDGVPCIRGLRIPVSVVLGMLRQGMTEKEILSYYPDLEKEDIREALDFSKQSPEKP